MRRREDHLEAGPLRWVPALAVRRLAAASGALATRDVLDRQGELAYLRAIGFSRRALAAVLLGEHAGILVAGLACGAVAGTIAAAPALASLAVASAIGIGATVVAARLAMQGDPIQGLRRE